MVLISVDLPRPVWPGEGQYALSIIYVKPPLPTQMMLNWKPRLTSFFSIWLVMLSNPT